MKNIRRKLLSQNFLRDRRLVAALVGRSSIAKRDLVLEIGPGSGIVTRALLTKAGQVIAIELDPYWCHQLQKMFHNQHNLILYRGDCLTHSLPRVPYKVFANIPFAIEGKIIRKLIEANNPPQDCYLVVMAELARRFTAQNRNNLFSALHQPWFEFSIAYHFKPDDFAPRPDVHAVLLRFVQKQKPRLPWASRAEYQRFVTLGYTNGRPVRANLKQAFAHNTIDQALHSCSISKHAKPAQLTVDQWVGLFEHVERCFFGEEPGNFRINGTSRSPTIQ